MSTTFKPTRFDDNAAGYAEYGTENTPIRRYAETYTVLKHARPLKGLNVLDAACSDGYFSRLLHAAGAAHVHGLDLSAAMIDVARDKTTTSEITYSVGDMRNIETADMGKDLVMSSFAQNYAADLPELQQVFQQFYKQLKPGGRFLALSDNAGFLPTREREYRKYGKSKTRDQSQGDGSVIDVCWYCTDALGETKEIPFKSHFYRHETLIAALETAGFINIAIHPTEVSAEGIAAFPAGYWDLLLNHSLFCVITADKPDS